MNELVEYIARSLVDETDQVEVSQSRHGSEVRLKLRVAKEDMGRVIGKQGRIANAIRMLLNVAASRSGKQAYLDIDEPE